MIRKNIINEIKENISKSCNFMNLKITNFADLVPAS